MKKLITLSLVTIPLLLQAEVTLDAIEVNANEKNTTSISSTEVLYQKEGYMKAAPSNIDFKEISTIHYN